MVRWISQRIGTASFYDDLRLTDSPDSYVLDVRELIDGEGNDPVRLRMIIEQAVEQLRLGRRVLICCDKGISRSNAIAVGALLATGEPYSRALKQLAGAGATEMNLGMLREIRALYEPQKTPRSGGPRRILLTGASGFVGRAALTSLAGNYELLVLDRGRYDLSRDLLALDDFVNTHQVDTILHLAHPRTRNSVTALGEALMMMKTVLELRRLNGLRLVYLSGLVVFSGYAGAGAVRAGSDLSPRPKGLYAETKYLCEQLIHCYAKAGTSDLVVLRPGAVYGPGMDKGMFVPKFFEWARQNKAIRTHRYSNGLPAFDFLYIDDLVGAIHRALEATGTYTIHIGTGVTTTTHALAQAIVRLTHSSSQIETLDIQGEAAHVTVNPAEAAEHLQFEPKVDLESGLAKIWEALCRGRKERPAFPV